jgi:UDP-N-acetylmuramate: L-alanyl-gamma-D-glutamyl-meso-diaminopimelate ligase
MSLDPKAHIYFVGIGGTGMASVAGLCQMAGYRVSGSDAGIYPPMSTMLEHLKIPVLTPYSTSNIDRVTPDLVVVANALSRGHVELEKVLESGLPFTSFPKLLGDLFLSKRETCVVAGTHGKTTTTSLLAHVLLELGADPGYLIGGIPRNQSQSFALGTGPAFVIEGDEYDTAFFDKGPKFLHYCPKHLIFNNLEFDHADIYASVEAIEAQFERLLALVPNKKNILANVDDPGVFRVIERLGLARQVTRVATLGQAKEAEISVVSSKGEALSPVEQVWSAVIRTTEPGDLGEFAVRTSLSGRHNIANIAQVVAAVLSLRRAGALKKDLTSREISAAIETFEPPKRRMELLAHAGGISVFEDFAHHPTAVRLVIEGFKAAYPDRRLIVAFEPRSASNRRNVFQKDYAKNLNMADLVMIGECLVDQRIPVDQRFNPDELKDDIGSKAHSFGTNAELFARLASELRPGDAVIFMSSGSFSGVQHQLAHKIRELFS